MAIRAKRLVRSLAGFQPDAQDARIDADRQDAAKIAWVTIGTLAA